MQDRRNVAFTEGQNIFGATVSPLANLWTPTDVVAGMQDLRLTLRRLRFTADFAITLTGAGVGTGDVFILYMGVALAVQGEAQDPSLISSGGQRSDWLWLGQTEQAFTGASPQAFTPSILRNIENQASGFAGIGLIDIKSQRKLEQDEVIALYAQISNVNQPGGSRSLVNVARNLTAATINSGQVTSSVVYERTMRR